MSWIILLVEFKMEDFFNINISFIWNIFFYFLQSENFMYNYVSNLFDKEQLLYWINILNFIKYIFYKQIKYIIINLYYYIFHLFIIFIYSNMPNKFMVNYISYYYILKKNILKYYRYIIIGYIKPTRFWRLYYRFYHISYLKVLLFFFCFILLILMWKRRNTYLKRFFIWNLLLFYIYAVWISFLFWPLFLNKFFAIVLSLLFSFFIIYIKLN